MNENSKLISRYSIGGWALVLATLTCTPAQAQFSFGNFGSTAPTSGASTGSAIPGGPASSAMGAGGLGAGPATVAPGAAPFGGQGPGLGGSNQSGGQLDAARGQMSSQDASLGEGSFEALGRGAQRGGERSAEGRSQGEPRRPGSRSTEPLNQFQQFVMQATGRVLPIYGQELFERPEVYMADNNAPASDDYVLGPGDEVRVQVWGGVNYDGTLTVDRNGQVNVPRAGVVTLAGVRVRDLQTVLQTQLGSTYTNFNMNASVAKLRSIQVYVVGQAKQPGTYNLSSLSTLVNALFASGGPSANGSMRNIQLKRAGKVVTSMDLYDFIGKGDKSRDVALQAGDVIVIPPVGPRAAVTGALDTAAIYELKDRNSGTSSIGDILSLNGGVPVLATSAKALIERVIPGQNPPRQVQDISLDTAGLKEPLQDGDVVTLLNISPAFGNAVTLQGNVAAPLRYRWFPGMKVRDLIPERDALITADYYVRKNMLVQNTGVNQLPESAGKNVTDRVRGIVDQINWDYAVVERLDRDRLKTQLIPFNLGAAVVRGDPSQNLELQPGDVVTILSDKDLRLPVERQSRLVRVEGEVAAPGVYEAMPGETMSQLIRRVGGLTPQAYVFGTQIDRESVRKKQQENLDLLISRLEQQQQSQMLFLVANRSTADLASQAAIMQQQQALARTQIASLRQLKSNGRISLELNPDASNQGSYPELPLEDGDRIVVPPVPGFVAAVGAVNNENVFIYKPGRTVADVMKSSGLRDEADPDLMFILRADGSVVSRSDRKSFFGNSFDSTKMMPGDTLVVPEKLDRETTRNFIARQLKDYTQILSQFGLGVAAIKVIKDL